MSVMIPIKIKTLQHINCSESDDIDWSVKNITTLINCFTEISIITSVKYFKIL